jgi:hypothetical protein
MQFEWPKFDTDGSGKLCKRCKKLGLDGDYFHCELSDEEVSKIQSPRPRLGRQERPAFDCPGSNIQPDQVIGMPILPVDSLCSPNFTTSLPFQVTNTASSGDMFPKRSADMQRKIKSTSDVFRFYLPQTAIRTTYSPACGDSVAASKKKR